MKGSLSVSLDADVIYPVEAEATKQRRTVSSTVSLIRVQRLSSGNQERDRELRERMTRR